MGLPREQRKAVDIEFMMGDLNYRVKLPDLPNILPKYVVQKTQKIAGILPKPNPSLAHPFGVKKKDVEHYTNTARDEILMALLDPDDAGPWRKRSTR